MPVEVDVLIVGGGPVGLYASYYAGFRGLTSIVCEALPQVGGQAAMLYPNKEIRDLPGFPVVRGRELVAALLEQAGSYGGEIWTESTASNAAFHDDGASVAVRRSSGDLEVRAKGVVIAAGIGLPRPRLLPAAQDWNGDGLHYFVHGPIEFVETDTVIVGGGDSALDWAEMVAPVARTLTIVHRGPKFSGHASAVQSLLDRGVLVHLESEITRLIGSNGTAQVSEVEVRSKDNSLFRLPAQRVISALGFISNLGELRSWDLRFVGRGIAADRAMRANQQRVYVAGEAASYGERVNLLAVGMGEAATAINHLAVELEPSTPLMLGHSTDEALRPPSLV